MKKTIIAVAAMMLATLGTADAKTLVAYYSRSGNTAAVADIIKRNLDADAFEITTADAEHYPSEYRAMTEFAKAEIQDGNYPAIAAVPNLTEYDTIFIGTPCWWGTMAGPVHTFLTTQDLSNKTIIPFNTHEGSGAGNVHNDIEKLTPWARHKQGIAVRGSNVAGSASDIADWLQQIDEK